MKRHILSILSLCLPLCMLAANTKTSVSKVSTQIAITDDVDFQITNATPFTDEGLVNIVNTEHAVVILTKVKPSFAISHWLSKVQINGAKAVNNRNCQVKIWDKGCIIMPYKNSIRPLTVFSEQQFEGESVNAFGTENTGGYMNTLSEAKLNNRIRSFKLKRGYMVTFSTLPKGRGYSRCFIAADKDLEVATLPAVLDQKISSYRVFKWYDTGKPQIAAAGGNTELCSALNVTSTYTWGTTSDMSPDVENVPHHIYENYPSPSALGACTTSPHMKTNNEPMNPADDPKNQTEDVDAVLANWQDLMATGMRLCSPSSWDGSDYTNGTGYIKRFIDSIDARGWRCDIIDLHCYWPESNFNTIGNWTSSTGRPVWISEWVWGASWNNNGAFASGVTESKNAETLRRICPVLNNNDCIERYYYWNFERDPSKLYKNGSLTAAGNYYASITSGVGYNGKYDFVPTTPPQYGPRNFKQTILDTGQTRLSWYDANGEFNQLMEVQTKDANGLWVVLDTIHQKEAASNYTYTIDSDDESILYRLHLIDLFGKEYYTNNEICVGDAFEIDGQLYYAGGNVFPNGDFDLGFTAWTSGSGQMLAEPQFQVVGDGGFGGGPYLQSHLNGSTNNKAAIKTAVSLVPAQNYIFRIASRNGSKSMSFYYSESGTALTKVACKATDEADWHEDISTFNSGEYAYGILSCRNLEAKAQIDGIQLRQLFPTREEAFADAVAKTRLRAEAQKAYNTAYPFLNDDLDARLNAVAGTDAAALAEAEAILAEHLSAIRKKEQTGILTTTLQTIFERPCPDYQEMLGLLGNMNEAQTAVSLIGSYNLLDSMMHENLAFSLSSKQPKNPSFAGEKSDGWEIKAGTFKDGDQKATTKFGKTCWNAWWSTTRQDATMEIRQTIKNLPEGYYQMECKALTEHFCISDQHGYLKSGSREAVTPTIGKAYYDLPVENHWDTLTTTPIYVEPNGSLIVGFVSSKQGAKTGWWHKFGEPDATSDNREGWWCATDFVLMYHPIDDVTGISEFPESAEFPAAYYDLSGRKLGKGNLPKGIYIKLENGKAVLRAR